MIKTEIMASQCSAVRMQTLPAEITTEGLFIGWIASYWATSNLKVHQ